MYLHESLRNESGSELFNETYFDFAHFTLLRNFLWIRDSNQNIQYCHALCHNRSANNLDMSLRNAFTSVCGFSIDRDNIWQGACFTFSEMFSDLVKIKATKRFREAALTYDVRSAYNSCCVASGNQLFKSINNPGGTEIIVNFTVFITVRHLTLTINPFWLLVLVKT